MDNFLSGFSHSHAAGHQQIAQNYTGSSTSGTHGVNHHGNVSEVDASQLQKGDTFQGEIASVNGEEVQIKLLTGQYMTARLERDVQVAIGQILNFQVQSNRDNRVVLKPVNINNIQFQRVGQAALSAANLVMSEKNLSMVSKMIENGMPIDKNTLMSINKFSLQHPQADVEDIIKMVKLKLPVTESNLAQFKSYQGMEHKLLDGINETSEDIFKAYQNLSQGNNQNMVSSANKFMEQVIKIFSEQTSEKASTQAVQGAVAQTDMSAENGQSQVQNEINNQNPSSAIAGQETMRTSGDMKGVQLVEQELMKLTEALKASKSGEAMALNGDNSKLFQGFSDKVVELMKEGALNIKEVNYLLANNNIMKNLPAEIKNQIFSSEPFKSMIKNGIRNQWTISPEDLTEDGKIQEFYEKLARQSRELTEAANNAMQSAMNTADSGMRAANNIRENVEFMNQMNMMFNYIQLPLKLSNSQAHGDLYVYTNKRNLAKKDGTLTAFLHLDMDNLGGVDINIELQTQRSMVTTKFYVEEEVIDLMSEHMDEFNDRLVAKGYECKSHISRIDNEKTVLEHIEEQVMSGNTMLRYQTFDTRA